MMELVVCSGKGGTGKTSVVASLAALAHNFVLADCDVDAANLHLVLEPMSEETQPFIAGHLASIRPEDCGGCGVCRVKCRFSAIERVNDPETGATYQVNQTACEGCGVCVHFCPRDAIDFEDRRCGQWSLSSTRVGPMVHASLDVGAENSGKLVSLVRTKARELAVEAGHDLILVDGPPGIGCPVTASLTGADLALMVTEPSLSGLHDLGRVLDLADHFQIPARVCINKYDFNIRLTERIEAECAARGARVIGRIPYEPLVNDAQIAGRSLVEFAPDSDAAQAINSIWHHLEHSLTESPTLKG